MSVNMQSNWVALGATIGSSSERQSGRPQSQVLKKLKPRSSSESPAVMHISEGVRIHASSLVHQINEAESDVSLLQTASDALGKVEEELREWSAELEQAVADGSIWEAARLRVEAHLEEIDRIAAVTHYGAQNLLDGSRALKGFASGEHLEFIQADGGIPSSPAKGYPVEVKRSATRAELRGQVPLTREYIDHEERLVLKEGRSEVQFITRKGEDLDATLRRLALVIRQAELPLELVRNPSGVLHFRHVQYGSRSRFSGASATSGVLSPEANLLVESTPGMDIVGTINGEPVRGMGQLLIGPPESSKLGGLCLRFNGTGNNLGEVGSVTIFQNGVPLHVGGATQSARLCLKSIRSNELGTQVSNASGFTCLADIQLERQEEVSDARQVVEKALKEVHQAKARIDLVNQEQLQAGLRKLRQDHLARQGPFTPIKDSGTARYVARNTRMQIMKDSGTSTMAQAHQTPETVMHLLK